MSERIVVGLLFLVIALQAWHVRDVEESLRHLTVFMDMGIDMSVRNALHDEAKGLKCRWD